VYGAQDWFTQPLKILGKDFNLPCPIHTTPTHQKFSDAFYRAYEIGKADQYLSSLDSINILKSQVQQLQEKLDSLQEATRTTLPGFQTHTHDGKQIIETSKGYVYVWDKKPELQVGDLVELPSGGLRKEYGWGSKTYKDRVHRLGSTKTRELSSVIGLAKP